MGIIYDKCLVEKEDAYKVEVRLTNPKDGYMTITETKEKTWWYCQRDKPEWGRIDFNYSGMSGERDTIMYKRVEAVEARWERIKH